MEHVYDYITRREYECHHCNELPPDFNAEALLVAYELFFNSFKLIREEWGKPIHINSGYRCPEHNLIIGGKPLSVHQFGLALDLDCKDVDEVYRMDSLIESMYPNLRRGRYTRNATFIHIDSGYLIRPRASYQWKEYIRWTG